MREYLTHNLCLSQEGLQEEHMEKLLEPHLLLKTNRNEVSNHLSH